MWFFLIITIFISGNYCAEVILDKTYSKEVEDPNKFDNLILEAENSNGNVLFGFESGSSGNYFCKKKYSEEDAVNFNFTMRRLVNLLLKNAHFKDVEGNTVALESSSNSQYSELIMYISVSVNPSELEILREYGQKKKNLAVRQIDELLTNIFNADVSQWWNGCKPWSLSETWDNFINKVDILKVVFIGSVMCLIIAILKIINNGACSQMMFSWIIFLVIAMSTLWEYSRMLEEETIKQYSESLRLGKVPEHCLGEDNRNWWQVFFRDDSKEQCFLHHYHQSSNPILRVTLWKALLSQLQAVMDVVVYSFRKLIANDPTQWFWSNMYTQGLICTSLVMITGVFLVIKFYGILKIPFVSFSRNNESSRLGSKKRSALQGNVAGSRVQTLPSEDGSESEGLIRPPPRRKNGNKIKNKRSDEIDNKSSMPAIIFNITTGGTHTVVPSISSKSDPVLNMEKATIPCLDKNEKKKCELCQSISTTENEDPGTTESENNEIECLGVVSEKTKDTSGSKNCDKEAHTSKTDDLVKDDSSNTELNMPSD